MHVLLGVGAGPCDGVGIKLNKRALTLAIYTFRRFLPFLLLTPRRSLSLTRMVWSYMTMSTMGSSAQPPRTGLLRKRTRGKGAGRCLACVSGRACASRRACVADDITQIPRVPLLRRHLARLHLPFPHHCGGRLTRTPHGDPSDAG